MACSRRRLFLFAVFLVFATLVAGGPALSLPVPTIARAANGDASAEFDPLSPVNPPNPANTANPPRLLAGDLSHALPALADLSLGTNGYCVTLHTQNLTPYSDAGIPAQNLGFTVVATGPIASSSPPVLFVPLPGALRVAEPWLTSVDAPPGFPATPTANGDKFCVVVQAPQGYTTLAVNWDYKDADGVRHTITLNDPGLIPIVTVTLRATAVGSFASVCTVGWDPSFLTGHTSNNNVLPGTPDPLNVVTTADWTVTLNAGNVSVISVQHDTANPVEWCVSLKSNSGAAITTNVSFAFDSVYNRVTNADDQAHTITIQGLCPVNIPGGFAIAHIGAGGEVLAEETSPALVIGTREYACILDTTNTDTMQTSDISITAASGADKPNVTGLAVFHAPGSLPSGSSVAAGTLCFTWTSSIPGEQLVAATFLQGGTTTRHAQWVGTTGTDCALPQSGFLVVQWNRIDRTAITNGATPLFSGPDANDITNTTLTYQLQFNAADGTFLAGTINLAEFVMGSHNTGGKKINGFLQGVQFRARIVSQGLCGHFEVPTPLPGTTGPQQVFGTSISGRFELNDGSLNPAAPAFGDTDASIDDLQISIDNDPCTAGSAIQVQVDVFYPGATTPALASPETMTINFVFYPPNKTPQIAWAGQTVTITYGFSSSNCTNLTAYFVRGDRQRGSFVGGNNTSVSGKSASQPLDPQSCSATIKYTSADPGEVDIEAFLYVNGEPNPYSKVGFPIFFLAIEDVTLTSPATQNVSDVGDVVATVRGYFVGTNPSGREAETKPDGRRVPADRWVIPDDWDTLRGPSEFRGNWGSADLPPLNVTFLMQDEPIVNSYKDRVSKGAVGWFIPDLGGNGSSPPEIGRVPDGNGVYPRPRIMTAQSDLDGVASVHNFGDWNLSYEGCAANIPTGNPHCKVGDIVGHTRYYAVADYAEDPGKFPQVGSNVSPTDWTWAGFKQVTIIPGDVPFQKYVVAHLLDRDGFCDAASWNNVLGVKVAFHIDSGDGVILEAQGQPAEVSSDRRSAVVTTFDLLDDAGKAMNADIARPTVDPNECQAWIKVSDSLMNPINVIVTFPAQPAPIPAPVRITRLVCGEMEEVTVTNKGLAPVSLAGFALRSRPPGGPYFQEQHLGLTGLLQPGESATFPGGPSATAAAGWIPGLNYVMADGASDYMRLVWDNFELNRVNCAGQFSTAPAPDPLPPDQEGQLVVDQVVEFNTDFPVSLVPGWNLVTAGVGSTNIAQAFAANSDDLLGIYLWDFEANRWKRYLPGVPAGDAATTIDTLEKEQIYWVAVKRAFTVTLLK